MTKLNKNLIIATMLLIGLVANAGDKVLNGGNVVKCQDGKIELLDYYELRLNGGSLSFDSVGTSYIEKLSTLFKSWNEIAPVRMRLYTQWLNDFQNEASFLTDIKIPSIPDTGAIALPTNCELEPAAFQRRDEDLFPGIKRYVINKTLWDRMDEQQRAGLVLHELIYREGIQVGHDTSAPTRYFNSYLSSNIPKTQQQYAYVVSILPLEWVEYNSEMILKIGNHVCKDNSGSQDCYFERLTSISTDGFRILAVRDSNNLPSYNLLQFLKQEIHFNDYKLNIKESSEIYFNNIKCYFEANESHISSGCRSKFTNQPVQIYDQVQILDNNKNVQLQFRLHPDEDKFIVFNTGPNHLVPAMKMFYFRKFHSDPESSFIYNTDGSRIDRISYFGNKMDSEAFDSSFETEDGSVWTFNKEQNKYVPNAKHH